MRSLLVDNPPSRRRVSATRASVESTGWQEMKISRSRSSPTSSSSALTRSGTAISFVRQFAADLIELAFQPRAAAEAVDCAMLGSGHQPCAWILRNARLWPLLERGHQSILRQVLGNADVAHHPRQPGDEPWRLDSPDCINCPMGVRHSYPSHHLQIPLQVE